MEILCTTCCKEKRTDPGLMPAIERYVSKRIAFVHEESRRLGKPMLILSGKFGLLKPEEPIPWYDQRLVMDAVQGIVPLIAAQLKEKKITQVVFYCLPKTDPGWYPYHEALERACRAQNVRLSIRLVAEE